MEIFTTKNSDETFRLGERLAPELSKGDERHGVVIGLSGELGSGKTTFVQGFAKGLGLSSRITSPTFILMRSYELNGKSLYHVDLYRLEGKIKNQLDELGLPSVWKLPDHIVLIEWADKIRDVLPDDMIWIEFKHTGDNKREIRISS